MRTFNVLCPGPSLAKLDLCLLESERPNNAIGTRRPGAPLERMNLGSLESVRTIAVNGAIAAYPAADYWAMQDWEVYDPAFDKPVLFVPTSWTTHRPNIARSRIAYDKGLLGKAIGIDLEFDRYTMTAAIGLALFCGAERIILFGADMQGEGYAYGCGNKKTNHSEKRWVDERVLLAEIMRLSDAEIIRK